MRFKKLYFGAIWRKLKIGSKYSGRYRLCSRTRPGRKREECGKGNWLHQFFEERICWITTDRNLRELLLVEVIIPTSSGEEKFRLSSTFR